MKRSFGLAAAIAMASLAMPGIAMTKESGIVAGAQTVSRKSKKAVKRMRFAEPLQARSKNPPTKRRLKRNLVTHSRRVRRKHRKAA